MTDPTTTPPSAPATPSPAIVPAYLTLLDNFANDVGALCDTASANGLTANMIFGQLGALAFWVLSQSKRDAANAPPIVFPGDPPAAPPAAPTPAPVAPSPPAGAPTPPAPVPEPSPPQQGGPVTTPADPPVATPAPQPVTPGPNWVDAAGQTYADWQASVTAAQNLAANMGVSYTPGPTPVFTAPSAG